LVIGVSQIGQRVLPRIDPLPHADSQGTLEVLNSFLVPAQTAIGNAQIGEREPFVGSVIYLAEDCQRLLIVLNRFLVAAQKSIRITQTVKRDSFAGSVFHRTLDHQRMLEVLNCLFAVSQIGIGKCPDS
jgi:hypothetical protein